VVLEHGELRRVGDAVALAVLLREEVVDLRGRELVGVAAVHAHDDGVAGLDELRARALEHAGDHVPGGVNVIRVGHVGHRTARRHVRQDDANLGPREDVRRFGHEVDAAEEHVLGLGLGGGVLGELAAS
jgi:hypothetical protein